MSTKPSPNWEYSIACPEVWDYKRKPCEAWGGPMSHGCKLAPWHEGDHVCPCGSRKKVSDAP